MDPSAFMTFGLMNLGGNECAIDRAGLSERMERPIRGYVDISFLRGHSK